MADSRQPQPTGESDDEPSDQPLTRSLTTPPRNPARLPRREDDTALDIVRGPSPVRSRETECDVDPAPRKPRNLANRRCRQPAYHACRARSLVLRLRVASIVVASRGRSSIVSGPSPSRPGPRSTTRTIPVVPSLTWGLRGEWGTDHLAPGVPIGPRRRSLYTPSPVHRSHRRRRKSWAAVGRPDPGSSGRRPAARIISF
jgi:hypothetical protein